MGIRPLEIGPYRDRNSLHFSETKKILRRGIGVGVKGVAGSDAIVAQ